MIRLTPGVHLSHFYQDAFEFIEGTLFLIAAEKNETLKYLWIYPDEFDPDFLYRKVYEAGVSISTVNLVSVSEWFVQEGNNPNFNDPIAAGEFIKAKFKSELDAAAKDGYDGICAFVSFPEISSDLFIPFQKWSELLNELTLNFSIIMMHQYDINQCTQFDVIDITALHEYVLTKRFDKWKITHNSIHHEMKRELERSRDFYLTLLEDFPSLIWRAGLNAECDYFNKNWLAFTGRTIDQEVGNGWVEGVHPEDIEQCVSYYLAHFEKRLAFSMEYRLKRYDGEYRWIVDMGMPFYNLEKKFAGYIGSCYDITDHKNMEQNLIIATEAAQKANTAKSVFLSNTSHEIRTPMTGLIGMLELISKDELTDRQKDYLSKARSSANLLINIINDILDLSKIEAGKLEIREQSFVLKDLLDSIIDSLRPISDKKSLNLESEYDIDLPKYVTGDSIRISQILLNLIGNAIKFTKIGSIKLSANLVSVEDNLVYIRFAVSDTGIGIPPEEISNIFNSFTQVPSAIIKNVGGTGLGLSISKKLVLLLGSELFVESKEGIGSIFSFTLKLKKSNGIRKKEENNLSSSSDMLSTESVNAAALKRILVVEDDEINMLFIREVLSEKFSLDMAYNGNEAVEYFEKNKYDMILMDVNMPMMNGYEATQIIRSMEEKNGGHTPIIGFTAYALVSDVDKCIHSGMDNYITKPIDSKTLLGKINEYLK